MDRPVNAESLLQLDKRLEVVKLQCYPIPEQVVWQAGRNDYSEVPIHNVQVPSHKECGEWIVNTLLANERGHYGCYSSDTQVLTDSGWVYWPKVTKDTVLAAYNTETGVVTFETPSAVQRWDYKGKMYHLEGQALDFLVSPDHRMIVQTKETDGKWSQLKAISAEELYNSPQQYRFTTSENLSVSQALNDFLRNSNQISTVVDTTTNEYKQEWVDYEGQIHCATVSTGALIVRRNNKVAVCGNCLEHPQITFSCAGFVHNVVVQGRTHRIGTSWDVQSQRYTGKRVLKVANGELDVEDVFYVRPAGFYVNRQGKKYEWTEEHRQLKLARIIDECREYADYYQQGFAEEHIRDYLPQAIRQNFVVSFNLRSVLHFLDLRAKLDAQLEIEALCSAFVPELQKWAPNVWSYYEQKRYKRARLSP